MEIEIDPVDRQGGPQPCEQLLFEGHIGRLPHQPVGRSLSQQGRHEFLCLDSSVSHDFTFTPAISFAIICATEEEIDRLFAQLGQGVPS